MDKEKGDKLAETNRDIWVTNATCADNDTLLHCQHCEETTQQVTQVRTHRQTFHHQPPGSILPHHNGHNQTL